MGGSCNEGQYWDILIKKCMDCPKICKPPHIIPRCMGYCESAMCKAQPGHYYDMLLKKCVRCAGVCGRHPAECSKHCQTSPPPVTTETPHVTSHSGGLLMPAALGHSTVLLYSLLALCMMLLFTSLFLALVVFLRRTRARTSTPGPKEANYDQMCGVQLGQEVGQPGCQPVQSYKDFVTNSSRPAEREPSDDSSPTETCVCVHCFPDLKPAGQGNDGALRAPMAVPHRAQVQNGGPLWSGENLYTSGWEVQEEAAVG